MCESGLNAPRAFFLAPEPARECLSSSVLYVELSMDYMAMPFPAFSAVCTFEMPSREYRGMRRWYRAYPRESCLGYLPPDLVRREIPMARYLRKSQGCYLGRSRDTCRVAPGFYGWINKYLKKTQAAIFRLSVLSVCRVSQSNWP